MSQIKTINIGRQKRRWTRVKFEKELIDTVLQGDDSDRLNAEADFAAKQAALNSGKVKEKQNSKRHKNH